METVGTGVVPLVVRKKKRVKKNSFLHFARDD